VYALIFIGALLAIGLAIGLVVDWRAGRTRRALTRPASLRPGGRAARYDSAQARVEQTAPVSTTQPGWHHGLGGVHYHG
jgi:hypothetical protein